jgi:phosphate/sulfate permease
MKENIARKLTSRKFWVALTSFIGSLLVAFNVGENDIAQVTAILTAFGSLMIYILSESAVDAANKKEEKDE